MPRSVDRRDAGADGAAHLVAARSGTQPRIALDRHGSQRRRASNWSTPDHGQQHLSGGRHLGRAAAAVRMRFAARGLAIERPHRRRARHRLGTAVVLDGDCRRYEAPRTIRLVAADFPRHAGRIRRLSYEKFAGHVDYSRRRVSRSTCVSTRRPGVWLTAAGTVPLSVFDRARAAAAAAGGASSRARSAWRCSKA